MILRVAAVLTAALGYAAGCSAWNAWHNGERLTTVLCALASAWCITSATYLWITGDPQA